MSDKYWKEESRTLRILLNDRVEKRIKNTIRRMVKTIEEERRVRSIPFQETSKR